MNQLKLIAFFFLITTPAFAHPGHDATGFSAGILHPLFGLDHILAMVAVGLWAALRGGRAILVWPVAFVGAMLAGFGLAQFGFVVPVLETMIAASVIGLGTVLALGLGAPVLLGTGLIATFGLVHGFAHGQEVSGSVPAFAAGFAIATATLHAAGLALGVVAIRLSSALPLRIAGAGIALAGMAMISGLG
jgi:urease accessory protein